MYKIGDVVRLNRPVPQGPVSKMRMDEDGTIWYLMAWTGEDGLTHERWFTGDDLVSAE